MRSLIEYIEECMYTTPANIAGMGGIGAPTETEPGTGDIPCAYCKKQKRPRKLKKKMHSKG